MEIKDLKIGDIILCYDQQLEEEIRKELEKILEVGPNTLNPTQYAHAGIYVGENYIAHSDGTGVNKKAVSTFFEDYQYLVVLRTISELSSTQQSQIIEFSNCCYGSPFNKDKMRDSIIENSKNCCLQIDTDSYLNYQQKKQGETFSLENGIFCSEFVYHCLCACGHIHSSVRLANPPEACTTEHLKPGVLIGSEFIGYLRENKGDKVQEGDQFLYMSKQ